jgi:hypothetical protein
MEKWDDKQASFQRGVKLVYVCIPEMGKKKFTNFTSLKIFNLNIRYVFYFFYGSTALVGLGRFFSSLIYIQSVGLLGQARRKAATYTQDNTKAE